MTVDRPSPAADASGRRSASEPFLAAIGARVRSARARHGMTRKDLAKHSGVSERHLAQLEAGKGNISVGLLRHVALALATPIGELLREGVEPTAEQRLLHGIVDRLSAEQAREARRLLEQRFASRAGRLERLALIGLRGAGKTSVGERVAALAGVGFVELAHEVERTAGLGLEEIFELSGQAGYRRYEQTTLERIIEHPGSLVLATGGGIVSDNQTFQLLLSGCFTVWLKAEPEQHMQRVIDQGDERPMAGNRQAMLDLRRILASREALYAQADATVDTAETTVEEAAEATLRVWQDARAGARRSRDAAAAS